MLPDEVVLSVESLNLDTDEGDEQILTVRKTGSQFSGLAIVVADYLPERRGWIRSWESMIPVTKLTTLQIQARDIIGDHWLSIIVTGMDEKNQQTLSVFKERRGSEKAGLTYDKVSSLAADTVFVDAVDRPESYQLAQTNGEPYRLLAFSSDKDSTNPLDQIRSTWTWDPKLGKYAESARDKIPGAQVERDIALKVLTGRESDFESFLQGVWYDSAVGPRDARTRLLVFDRASSSITFFSSDAQEVFRWNESHSTRTGLYVGAQNESVQTLRRLLDIELTGAESVSVRVFEDLLMKIDSENRWDGAYKRLQNGVSLSSASTPELKIDGVWLGAGIELSFTSGAYSLVQGEQFQKGRYMLYKVGKDTVLELIEQRSGAQVPRVNYLVTPRQAKDGTRFIRLAKVLPSITGLEKKEEGSVELSQKKQR
ncbi:MAG: pallilysin-related adhesin [Spirochaetota bacterium]